MNLLEFLMLLDRMGCQGIFLHPTKPRELVLVYCGCPRHKRRRHRLEPTFYQYSEDHRTALLRRCKPLPRDLQASYAAFQRGSRAGTTIGEDPCQS